MYEDRGSPFPSPSSKCFPLCKVACKTSTVLPLVLLLYRALRNEQARFQKRRSMTNNHVCSSFRLYLLRTDVIFLKHLKVTRNQIMFCGV